MAHNNVIEIEVSLPDTVDVGFVRKLKASLHEVADDLAGSVPHTVSSVIRQEQIRGAYK